MFIRKFTDIFQFFFFFQRDPIIATEKLLCAFGSIGSTTASLKITLGLSSVAHIFLY